MNEQSVEYSPIAKILHWWIAGMIVLQFVLAKLADRAGDGGSHLQQLALLANHKSVGITILAIAIFRLLWRRGQPPPAPLPMPSWQETASRISHWSLYAFLFLMPITGWLMSSASAYSVSWFNMVQLPDFVAPNPELKETFEEIHETLAKLLLLVASIHVAAGLKHALINKDGALSRISSQTSIAIFVVVIYGGYLSLSDVSGNAPGTAAPAATTGRAASTSQTAPATGPPLWQIDYESSYIRFTGDQAGAGFDGEWQEWSAELRFSPENPTAGSFDVTVLAASVNTEDEDRDVTIVDIEWFDADNFPQVHFQASRFSVDTDGSFVAEGEMLVKNFSTPATLNFTVSENAGGRYVLDGTATLDRILLQVGTGEWADTDWIGQFVEVTVHVEGTATE